MSTPEEAQQHLTIIFQFPWNKQNKIYSMKYMSMVIVNLMFWQVHKRADQ